MKKFAFLIVLTTIIASCTTEEYYPKEVVEPYTFALECPIRSSDWILQDTPPSSSDPESSIYTYFYCDVKVPELTSWILEHGATMGFLMYTEDGKKVLTPLPLDDFYMGGYMWTEQATCEFSPGWVRFVIKYSDFDIDTLPPAYTFMIKFLW